MGKLSIIFTGCLFSVILAMGQVRPGGVAKPMVWYTTDSSAAMPTFRSKLSAADTVFVMPHAPANKVLNFHPSVFFDGTDSLSIRLPDSSLTGTTFFAVYATKSSNNEGVVWHLNRQGHTALVQTTSRMGDLENFKYMNFRDFNPDYPKVGAYSQQRLPDTIVPVKKYWNIGIKPVSPHLPVYSFYGMIPEVIAYDRVLTSQERLRVASYLSLKYGVTLSDPGYTYADSKGDMIWNGGAYPDYFHHIAGLARDDTSGLYQPKASSSEQVGLMTMKATGHLDDDNFILWGDNDKSLTLADKEPGIPHYIKKKWLVAATRKTGSLSADVLIDTRQLDVPLPVDPVYWLVLDRSGQGDFTLPDISFIRMDSLDKKGIAKFQKIGWGINGSSQEAMGLLCAQELLASVHITAPACASQTAGSLKVKVWGGQAPFQVTLTQRGGRVVATRQMNTVGSETIGQVAAGQYLLDVADAGAHHYRDTFYVNNADGPKPVSVAGHYVLSAGGSLNIRADSLMQAGTTYEWTGPDGFSTVGPQADLSRIGQYRLVCSLNGCSYVQDILVTGAPEGTLSHIVVYPNPSSGAYTADLSMDEPAGVNLSVYDISGHILSSEDRNGFANYRFTGSLRMPGMYLLVFRSGAYSATRKLLIIK